MTITNLSEAAKPVGDAAAQEIAELEAMIVRIGLAQFVGRINSGVIPAHTGYEAVENFVTHEKARPFLSKLTQAVLGKTDSYIRR